MNDLQVSEAIEHMLVARNPRQMQRAQQALAPGYFLRAAKLLRDIDGEVLIGTGFPVTDTFETDGPVGAIALYNALGKLGANPMLVCGPPLSDILAQDYRVLALTARDILNAEAEARTELARRKPSLVIAIERPGLAADGRYYNMRGEDISERCYIFDPFITLADCPTIGIGDGGNEIGMGNITQALADFDIRPSVTPCDELLIADVSNWGAYGLLAMLGRLLRKDLLAGLSPIETLNYLCTRGSVDGVTGQRSLTEDGMEARAGLDVIHELRALVQDPE